MSENSLTTAVLLLSLSVLHCGSGDVPVIGAAPVVESVGADAGVSAEAGSTTAGGLPCDVDAVLAKSCRSCHGATPSFGAPMPLVTYADLTAPAVSNPEKRVSDLVLARTHDDARPMPQPPAPRLSPTEQSTLDTWIKAGAPQGTSACGASRGDAGSSVPMLSCTPDVHFAPAKPFTMPQDKSNLYVCYGVDVPVMGKRHVTAFAPRIDNAKILHHIVVSQTTESVSPTPAPCEQGATGGGGMVYAWAPGVGALELPKEAGFPQEGVAHYKVQIHYNNIQGLANEVDATGVDLCTTDQLRPNDAAVMAFGTAKINIPAHGSLDVDCDFKVPAALKTPIHAFTAVPHMHELGTTIATSKLGGQGGTPVDMGKQATWDFQQQAWFDIDATVAAGDTIRTRCAWNNPKSSPVHFGENTEDEMCFSFTMYYPKITTPGWNDALPAASSKCSPHQ